MKTKEVKAIVIACNTASALALDAVKDEFDIPILGGYSGCESSRRGDEEQESRSSWDRGNGSERDVYESDPGNEPEITVIEKACPLFVPLVEEGFKEHQVTEEVIEYYLESMRSTDIDAMILGCTHYPLLRSKIRLIWGQDSDCKPQAYETAMDLKCLLEENDMANDGTEGQHSNYSFCT